MMTEISLNVLDVANNSIRANANLIEIKIIIHRKQIYSRLKFLIMAVVWIRNNYPRLKILSSPPVQPEVLDLASPF